MNPPRPLLRVLRELPWLVGVACGWFLLWLYGGAFVGRSCPVGQGWFDSMITGWEILHGGFTGADDWRRHLHPLMLAGFGERVGYVTAGVFLASAGTYALVVGAALGGRALAGSWAGGLAALAIPLVRVTAESSHWVTLYPPLAGVTGLALGLGCVYARWPRWWWAAATGLTAALAWSLDTRGLVVMPAILVLLGVGLSRRGSWRGRGVALALFVVGLAPTWICARFVDADVVPFERQLEMQRDVAHRWIWGTGDGALQTACRDFTPPDPIPLLGECSKALLAHNLDHHYRSGMPFPLWLTLVAALLALMPGRQGWRGSVSTAAVFVGVGAAFVGQGLLIPAPARYVLQFAVPVALAVPVGLARLGTTVLPARFGYLWGAAVAVAGAVYLLFIGNPVQGISTTTERDRTYELLQDGIDAIRAEVGPDDSLMDCSGTHLAVALLPDVLHDGPAMMRHVDPQRCQAWLESPESTGGGDAWILTTFHSTPTAVGAAGWEAVARITGAGDGLLLARWTGIAGAPGG